MPGMEMPRKLAVKTSGVLAEVTLDGVDISRAISRVAFDHEAGGPPTAYLTLTRGTAIELEGDALIRVVDTRPDRETVLEFLAAVDPNELEQAALADGRQFGEAVLSALARMVGGA